MLALLPALLLLAPALAHAQDYFINCGNARDGRFVANIAQTRTVVVASAPITGAQSQYLYQNHRTPISPVTSLTYTLPRRTPGIYLVELAFAEVAVATNTARCARGARLFHVDIQGTRVLTDFDVYATARGCRRALRRRFYNVRVAADGVFAVTITDGASGKAMISYINLKATGLISPTPPPPPSLASPSPQPSASPSPQPSASPKPSPSPKPTPSPSPTPVPERPLESCVGAGTIKRLAAGSAPKSRVDAVAAAALRKDAATGAGGSGRYTLALAARRGQRKGSRADAAAAAVKDTSGRISGLSRQAILARGSFFDTFDAVRGSEWWFAGPWANGGVFGNGFSPCYWTQAGGEISLPVQEEPFTNPSTAGSGVPGKVYDYTAGEIRSQGVDYGHGCYSWCAKPTSSSGVVSALYVYSSGIWDSPVEGTSVPWRGKWRLDSVVDEKFGSLLLTLLFFCEILLKTKRLTSSFLSTELMGRLRCRVTLYVWGHVIPSQAF